MDQASPDLLLMIFKKLNSKEMVSVMRVERKWLKIIDEHRSLWRQLVLPPKSPDEEEEGWGLEALELFDRKSNSTLKQVSMDVEWDVDIQFLVECLEKSKDTLRILQLNQVEGYKGHDVRAVLEERLWKLPNLLDCRLTNPYRLHHKIRLQLEDRDEDEEDNKGSSLRVLWIRDSSEKLIKSHLNILDNLVSLVLEGEDYDSSEMRYLLERPSRTLKHLQINIEKKQEQSQLPPLSFPNLKFLDITLYNESLSVFPSWMKIPSLSTLIIWSYSTLSSLPACSNLWLFNLDNFNDFLELASQCPRLVELRVDLGDMGRDEEYGGGEVSALERFNNLSSMLSQRKENVEAGVEIGGVKMTNLKTLVIPFDLVESKGESGLGEVALSKLREFVEEVIDLRTIQSYANPEIIEMEV